MSHTYNVTIIEVMEWMLDIQLGRRNLSPIQRIAITEKYRPIYEKQAKENQVHTATFRGQQGRVSRTVRAILNGHIY